MENDFLKRLEKESIKFCRERYGRKSKPLPKVIFRSFTQFPETEYRGLYTHSDEEKENIIEIDLGNHLIKSRKGKIMLDMEEVCDTIIHEYQHYLQDWRRYSTQEEKHEELAQLVAKRDRKKLVKSIYKKFIHRGK